MAMDNLALYVENMFKIMGDQFERHLYDKKYEYGYGSYYLYHKTRLPQVGERQ
jgi:hypothetical protein